MSAVINVNNSTELNILRKLVSVLSFGSVLLINLALVSENWVVVRNSNSASFFNYHAKLNYGLFKGQFEMIRHNISTIYPAYMTCLPAWKACAVSCKSDRITRESEVRALATRRHVFPTCGSTLSYDDGWFDEPPIIPNGIIMGLICLLILQLITSALSTILALRSDIRRKSLPTSGVSGILWISLASAALGLIALLVMGLHWSASSLQKHLAFSYYAVSFYTPVDNGPKLGYSYLMLVGATLCNAIAAFLTWIRMECDPAFTRAQVEVT